MDPTATGEVKVHKLDLAHGGAAADSVLLAALEQAPDAIVICDGQGLIEYVVQ